MAAIGPKQEGMALVLALLVVALVTAISVELSWRFDLSLTRAANRWHGVQANAYLRGAEEFAYMALKFDKEEDDKNGEKADTLDEMWASQEAQFPTDEGWLSGKLEDAQGRFNLNQLAQKIQRKEGEDYNETWKQFTEPQRRFIRLLQTINLGDEQSPVFLDEMTSVNITEAVIDWMDGDSTVTGYGGAESDYYGQLDPPYIIPNTLMASVSELNLIRGMTPELYEKLLPLVIALPADKTMNINTIPVELIRTMNSKTLLYPLPLEDATYLLQGRTGGGYENIDDFISVVKDYVPGANEGQNAIDTTGLGISSEYFIFYGETQVGDHIRTSKALLYRSGTDVKTIRRTDAHF